MLVRSLRYGLVPLAAALVVYACAQGQTTDLITNGDDGGTQGDDSGHGSDGGCPQNTQSCGGQCVNIKTDPANCGSCGKACSPGWSCAFGFCKLDCDAGATACNGKCVDTSSDMNNCGGCGNSCFDGGIFIDAGDAGGGSTQCLQGACTLVCSGGLKKCNGDCVDTMSDTNNCGQCGNACSGNQTCVNGLCCATGQSNCNGTCADLQTDPNNCGTCGNKCPNNSPTCAGGVCVICGTNDVPYNGHCYYLDGSKGVCDNGYALASQTIFTSIATMFAGKNYKHTISQNCCILNKDPNENYGMAVHCNQNGPFTANDVALGADGCTNQTNNYPGQLTLCGTP
jgi:hypothetical protein